MFQFSESIIYAKCTKFKQGPSNETASFQSSSSLKKLLILSLSPPPHSQSCNIEEKRYEMKDINIYRNRIHYTIFSVRKVASKRYILALVFIHVITLRTPCACTMELICFLAHLCWKLVSFSDRLLSVVHPAVGKLFAFSSFSPELTGQYQPNMA